MKQAVFYKQLVDRYLDGSASLEEVEVFFQLLNEGKLDQWLEGGETTPVRTLFPWKRYAIAAAVILLVGAGVLLLWKPAGKKTDTPAIVNVFKNDVAPGGNRAVLTLGDGSAIVLDSAAKGKLASQGNITIAKTDAGRLSYQATGNAAPAVLTNTLSTPAGGQYQVTLADGTKVWLNAVSKLVFPTEFRGADRTVELTGEAYFEVAKDRLRPFMVKVNGVQVQVLGTSFNVNAYTDESTINTTLLDGAVRLIKGEMAVALKPGQQGVTAMETGGASAGRTSIASGGLTVRNADIDAVMAWKNGLFSWDAADVHTVMRQLSRWYGVEVSYEGTPTRALFGGEIGRDLTLSQVLTGLSQSKVHFRLEGKKLTVLP